MSKETESSRWAVPFGVGYEKLIKIIRYVYQKKRDTNFVPVDSILTLTSINKDSIKSNLSFLKIIHVLDGDNSNGYKLTTIGTRYAKALSMTDAEEIKQSSLEIIQNSHLNDLKHFIENEGAALTKESLYKFIKSRARISDGDRFGEMPAVYSTGASALLYIFTKAGLINTEILHHRTTPKPGTPSSTKKVKKSPKLAAIPKQVSTINEIKEDVHSLVSNSFSITIKKNIDPDEIQLIKSQIDNFIKFIEKKANNST